MHANSFDKNWKFTYHIVHMKPFNRSITVFVLSIGLLMGLLSQGISSRLHHKSFGKMDCDTYDPADPNSFE